MTVMLTVYGTFNFRKCNVVPPLFSKQNNQSKML